MTAGPVEYIIVAFPGNKFNGEIAPELVALVESGTVRILDLIFIGKDDDGTVLAFEIDELESVEAFAQLEGEFGVLIGPAPPRLEQISRPTSRREDKERTCHTCRYISGPAALRSSTGR